MDKMDTHKSIDSEHNSDDGKGRFVHTAAIGENSGLRIPSKINSYNEELFKLKTKLKKYKLQLRRLKLINSTLTCDNLPSPTKSFLRAINELKDERDELQMRLISVNQAKEETYVILEEQQRQNHLLQSKLSVASREARALKIQLGDTEDNVQDAINLAEEKQKKIIALMNDLRELKSTFSDVSEENASLKDQIKDLLSSIGQGFSLNEDSLAVKELNQKLSQNQFELERMHIERKKDQLTVKKLENQLSEINLENKRLQQDEIQREAYIVNLLAVMEKKESDLHNKSLETLKTRTKLENALNLIEQLKHDIGKSDARYHKVMELIENSDVTSDISSDSESDVDLIGDPDNMDEN